MAFLSALSYYWSAYCHIQGHVYDAVFTWTIKLKGWGNWWWTNCSSPTLHHWEVWPSMGLVSKICSLLVNQFIVSNRLFRVGSEFTLIKGLHNIPELAMFLQWDSTRAFAIHDLGSQHILSLATQLSLVLDYSIPDWIEPAFNVGCIYATQPHIKPNIFNINFYLLFCDKILQNTQKYLQEFSCIFTNFIWL